MESFSRQLFHVSILKKNRILYEHPFHTGIFVWVVFDPQDDQGCSTLYSESVKQQGITI